MPRNMQIKKSYDVKKPHIMKEKELTKLLTIQRSEPGVDKGRQ
jgi:hypothetical protein